MVLLLFVTTSVVPLFVVVLRSCCVGDDCLSFAMFYNDFSFFLLSLLFFVLFPSYSSGFVYFYCLLPQNSSRSGNPTKGSNRRQNACRTMRNKRL